MIRLRRVHGADHKAAMRGVTHPPTVLRRIVRRRLLVGLIAAALAATSAGAALARQGTAPQRGIAAKIPRVISVRAAVSVGGTLSDVQSAFADGLLTSASADNTLLTVDTAVTDSSAVTKANFEAGVLARATVESMRAAGQAPVTTMNVVGAGPQIVDEMIGPSPTVSPLSAGTCSAAVDSAPSDMEVVSARTLPFALGTCIFDVRTATDPSAAVETVAQMLHDAVPDAQGHPWLVEVDDPQGEVQIILSWVPGLGGTGEGRAYVRSGLSSNVVYPELVPGR